MILFSLVSNIVTILAFFLAILAFFNWQKKQKNSKELDYIMGLEESFEVLIYDIENDFKWFSDLENNCLGIDNESKKYISDFIKNEFEKYQSKQTIENSFYNYSFALTKIKIFLKTIDQECPMLDYKWLRKLSIDAIKLKPKWKDKNNISPEAENFLKKITNIHKEGVNFVPKKYK